jgi:hypothetical protein
MCASAWKNVAPDFFGFGSQRASPRWLFIPDAQLLRWTAQLLKFLIFAASFEYIPSHLRSQKSRRARFFHHHRCNFRAKKIFSSQVASLRLRLCYYRQRSLKIFSTPCGSRKKLDRRSDA